MKIFLKNNWQGCLSARHESEIARRERETREASVMSITARHRCSVEGRACQHQPACVRSKFVAISEFGGTSGGWYSGV